MLAALAVCLLNCTDSLNHVLGPRSPSSQDSSVIPAPETKHGCALIEISVASGQATAVPIPTSSCGPVIPVVAGIPTFDMTTRVVSLPIAIRNGGLVNIHASVNVSAVADSIAVTASSGQAGTRPSFMQAAPVAGDKVSNARGSWSFDAFLADTSHAKNVIRSKGTSPSRSIQVVVPANVTTFRLPLRASGMYVFSIAMQPKRVSAEEELADSHKPENRVALDKEMEHPAVRNKLWLEFKNNATIEDRQGALDAVEGTVVGGMWLGVGRYYYVRIPAPRDSGAGPLLRAMEKLKAMPGVAWVMPHELNDRIKPAYRRPADSANAYDTWTVSPDAATGNPWAAEAVSAPLSWGCATGDTLTRVAVADQGFVSITDLAPNFSTDTVFQNTTPDSLLHGTWVSSVLAAVGNNHIGISGQMWTARLGLFWIRQPVAGLDSTFWPFSAVQRAAEAGYRVINISNVRAADSTIKSGHPTHADSMGVLNSAHTFEDVIAIGNGGGNRPLYVVAAGNDHIDAWWGGYATVKSDSAQYAPQILVVAADSNRSTHGWQLASFSNTGTLIDVAAPGVQVTMLGRNNALVHGNGTSFSAPLVSGIAGQLMSFDPTTTADSAKSYIVGGATDGGRQVGTYFLANAYKALQRAARRRGAPLCGNRVYTDSLGDTVYAERSGGQRDALGEMSLGGYAGIVPVHGGRTIYSIVTNFSLSSLSYDGTGWQFNSADTTFGTLSGQQISSYNLANQRDHDGDTSITVSLGVNCGGPTTTFSIGPTGGTAVPIANFKKGWSCNSSGFGIVGTAAAYSPVSRRMLISITTAGNASVAPPTLRTDVYSVPLDSGLRTPSKPLATLTNAQIGGSPGVGMGFSEDGSEVWSVTTRFSDPINTTWGVNTFSIDFWDPATFTLRASRSINNSAAAAGGISPNRVARRPPAASMNTHRSSSPSSNTGSVPQSDSRLRRR